MIVMRIQTRLKGWRDCMRTDTGVLLLLTLLFATRTAAYLLNTDLPVAHTFDTHVGVSPIIWGTGTVVMAVALLSRRRKLHSLALMCGVMVLTLWGLLFGWQGVPALLLYGSPYLAVAGLTLYTVWRGGAHELHVYGGDTGVRDSDGR